MRMVSGPPLAESAQRAPQEEEEEVKAVEVVAAPPRIDKPHLNVRVYHADLNGTPLNEMRAAIVESAHLDEHSLCQMVSARVNAATGMLGGTCTAKT